MEELDLKELFSLFWSKKISIILIILILMFVGIIYSYFFVTPEYTAVTKLVLVQNSSSDSAITSADLTINSKLVSTYSTVIQSDNVLIQVLNNLGIDEDQKDRIKNSITVSSVSSTDVIEIRVKNEDPNSASKIANEIASVFSEKVVEIYNLSNVYLLDRSEVPTSPSNINHKKDIAIFAFVGIVIAVLYVLICNMLDTTIKTEDDIEKITGLVVLTSIPNYEAEFKETKGGKK